MMTLDFTFNGDFGDIIIKKSGKLEKLITKAAQKAVVDTTDELFEQTKKNISLPMHGSSPGRHYSALGRLDHPFAARHLIIRQHGHDPFWGVHKVTGQMLRQLQRKYILQGNIAAFGFVGWDPATVTEDVRRVIFGTFRDGKALMLPRPVLRSTAAQMDIKQRLMDKYEKNRMRVQ